ncbi:MAG TPA: hypothetical protein VGR89_07710, partial [Puia sp.]|nr:hypothetical protein [Puia sp.]
EFRYDRNHRLTDFIGVYSFSDTTNGEFWHRYFYNSRGLITKDSVFIFPYIVNGQLSTYIYPRLIQLGYDDRGRVNIEINAYGGNDTIHYEYDAKGNLIGGTYDNKLSFRQTNRIWMFLDRDYSLNNRFIADSYYAGLLPLHIGLQAEEVYPLYFLYDGYFTTADITYTLK